MSTNGNGLTQQATNLLQNATAQIKTILSTDGSTKKKVDPCILSSKPSTMEDTNDCLVKTTSKPSEDLFKSEPDLTEEDRFRACFIDCSCDCSAKKITQGRIQTASDLGVFEKLLKNLKSNHYQVVCDCRCGDDQQRSFSFHYAAGSRKRTS